MKAYKPILLIVVLFLVQCTSGIFPLWNSEKIRDIIKQKINKINIPLITPRYFLFNHDYPIYRYYFLKPSATKNNYLSNTPANAQYSNSDAIYDSAANTQTTDLSNVDTVGQYGIDFIYSEENSDNVQTGVRSNVGESGFINTEDNTATDSDNADESSFVDEDSISETDSEPVLEDNNGSDTVNAQFAIPEDDVGNTDGSVNSESDIKVIVGFVDESGFIKTEDDAEDIVDADKSSFIDDEDTFSEVDVEPVQEDIDESSFVDAEFDPEVAFFDTRGDLVFVDDVYEDGARDNSEMNDHSDIGSVKEYDNTDIEIITGDTINNSWNDSTGYYPQIDIRIGGDDTDYAGYSN